MRALRTFGPFLFFFAGGLLEAIHFWLGYELVGGFSAGFIYRGQEITLLGTVARVMPSWCLMGILAMATVAVTKRYPITREHWRQVIWLHIASAIVFSAIAVVGNTTMRWLLYVLPETGTPSLKVMMIRYYALYFNTYFLEYWGIVGVYSAILFYRRMRERELALERLARGLSEARLAALQHQLRPHFLFNTLNAISALAGARDYRGTARAIGLLSDLLRMSLRDSGQVSTVARELRFAQRYLALQRLRFPDRLRTTITCDPALLPAEIPALLLQPLIENAVRYGIGSDPAPGSLAIEIVRMQDRLRACVRNSLPVETRAGRRGAGIGLNNVQARLAQLYGEDFAFAIDTNNAEWSVTIEWPLRFRVRPARERAALRDAAALERPDVSAALH
jgi:two-component system LytT family sensor kinase